ncbi:unnamed protein product [Rotaria sp. Silwood1]|nr:unnamed protein product [Rotaria sp. Silwood1]CAF5086090.1 unnamed protein product [Rotaria sp. Silwood1]
MNNESDPQPLTYSELSSVTVPVTSEEAIGENTEHTSVPRKTAAERVAEQFAPIIMNVTAAATIDFSKSEIIQDVACRLDRRYCQRVYVSLTVTLLCLVLCIISFLLMRQAEYESSTFTVFTIAGALTVMLTFGTCIFSCTRYCSRVRPKFAREGHIRYTMRIDGEQWIRFVKYFFSRKGRPSRARGWWFCCGPYGSHYKQSIERGYGYIILTSTGLMIDDLFCASYGEHIAIKVELLRFVSSHNDSSNQLTVDKMVRVWLCRRTYDSRCPPTPFKVDFFIPWQIPDYEVPGMVNFIALG